MLTVAGGIKRSYRNVVFCFNHIWKEWEKENLNLGEMLKLPEEEFRKLRMELVSAIREDLGHFQEWVTATGRKAVTK